MLRLMGAALLLGGCAALGLSAVRRLDGRAAALRSLRDALALMEGELNFTLPPMKQLLLETARRSAPPARAFLDACAAGMDELNGMALSELWRRSAVENLPALKSCDVEALCALGPVLGRYDGQTQRQAIAAVREQLAALLADAAGERRGLGRVYGAVSFAAGVFLVILLL